MLTGQSSPTVTMFFLIFECLFIFYKAGFNRGLDKDSQSV
jgi:hypothetical protein